VSVLDGLAEYSVDAICTDPPYHLTSIVKRFCRTSRDDDTQTSDRARRGADGMARLSRGFMGKEWDGGDIAFRAETWAKVLRVLKPGGHLVAFSAPKCSHRMVCAIEDAGFEIRDALQWMFGTGFPKSRDPWRLDIGPHVERELRALGVEGDIKWK
jgi:site-specific DNA-methyltransferase (adenine-specific)